MLSFKKVNFNRALYINSVFPDQANSYTLLWTLPKKFKQESSEEVRL